MRPHLALFGLIAALALPSLALAQEPSETYEARLSDADHYNSDGVRLATVAAIIRQDRANFHRFGVRDREDQDDAFFESAANRARLEALVARSHISPRTRRAILNGEPLVEVFVYSDWIEVELR
jgi:hypothetical protein